MYWDMKLSMALRFANVNVRMEKILRSSIGCGTVSSVRIKTRTAAAMTAASPSLWGWPIACQRLTMRRNEKRPTNALPAPTRSRLSPGRGSASGRILEAMRSAATPMGMLMKNMNRQPRYAAMNPPRVGPTASPIAMLVALIPSALPRSEAGNAPTMIAGPTAIIIPAVTPWTARAAISIPMLPESPQTADDAANPARPER